MRWPKPISRSPRASAPSIHGAMRSALPMASSISSTGSGAPPCKRPGQRAIGAGDRHEQVRLRRGDDARGEGRGVHAVIADGDEIGVERRGLFAAGRVAAQHAQRVGGMAEHGDRRHRRLAAGMAHQRRRDHRHGAHQHGIGRQPRLGRAAPRPPRGSRRRSACPSVAGRMAGRRRKARSRASPSWARTSASLMAWPFAADHSRAVSAFEADLEGQIVDPLAGDDQLAFFAVDMGEGGLGGGDAVQARWGIWTGGSWSSSLLRCNKDWGPFHIDQS